MYTKEQQIEKIKRFISEKEDDIKYLKEMLAKLLDDKKEINENNDLNEKINAPWKTNHNRIIFSSYSEEIPQIILDFISFDSLILDKINEKLSKSISMDDAKKISKKSLEELRKFEKENKVRNDRYVYFKINGNINCNVHFWRVIHFDGKNHLHEFERHWTIEQYKN